MCREIRRVAAAASADPVQLTLPLVRLTIDAYNLNQRSTRRLVIDSLRLVPTPIELRRLVGWSQIDGRWELLPRP